MSKYPESATPLKIRGVAALQHHLESTHLKTCTPDEILNCLIHFVN